MANLWELQEEIAEGGPSKANSRDSLFGEPTVAQKTAPMFVCFSKMFIVWMTETANKSE